MEATAAKTEPSETNPFRQGDAVVYPTHGVGRIERVDFEEIAGYRLHLIRISFEDNQMTLRVPVAQARAAGLRKPASREVLAAALAILKDGPKVSRVIWARRSQEYQARINTGNPGALAEARPDRTPPHHRRAGASGRRREGPPRAAPARPGARSPRVRHRARADHVGGGLADLL